MATNEIIFPYFENGEFAGVRVCLGDEDFAYSLRPIKNLKEE